MLKKTTEFKYAKREKSFKKGHKIGKNSFTRDRKLGFDKIMTMMMKKSNKSMMTYDINIWPNRQSKPRLDKDIYKSTIGTNSINSFKRKKRNVGN